MPEEIRRNLVAQAKTRHRKDTFEFSLTFSDAPIDKFARGDTSAMTDSQKRGALLFFGSAGGVQCHGVSGVPSGKFSDFRQHVIGLPQLFPKIGNVPFDGPGANEDFGVEGMCIFLSSPPR